MHDCGVDNNLPFTFTTVTDTVHNTSNGMHKISVYVHHIPFHSCDYHEFLQIPFCFWWIILSTWLANTRKLIALFLQHTP